MEKENLSESQKNKEAIKKIKPEDVILVQPIEPITSKEVLSKMKKQGLRPATLEELGSFLNPTFGIDPSKIIEGEVVPNESKNLLEHKPESDKK